MPLTVAPRDRKILRVSFWPSDKETGDMTGLPEYRDRRRYHNKSTIGEIIVVLIAMPLLALVVIALMYAYNAIGISF